MSTITVLCIGDIVGNPGRNLLLKHVISLQKKHNIDFTVANIENAAGGFGVTPKVYQELGGLPIHVFTSGNHIYDKHEIMTQFHHLPKVIRPLNFAPGAPGEGIRIVQWNHLKIAVVNLIGRIFMAPSDCPFRTIRDKLKEIQKETPIIIVDFHGEATSEKQAMGYFLDGDVSIVFGTHTHVQTADERVLEKGTAYISDLGMTGAKNGILGMEPTAILNRFLTGLPARFEPEKQKPVMINAIKVIVDTKSGKAQKIERIYEEFEE